LTDLRDDADRLLKLNFPNTKYQLAAAKAKRWYQPW